MVTGDDALADALMSDYRAAELSAADEAMLDYAVRLTREPATMARADVEALRGHGFDDRAVLQITLIAAFFNYVNRVAEALGVGRAG